MDFTHLTPEQWLVAALAALTVGFAKSGFGGVGMLTVVLMASIMPGHEKESTGVVLPLLICGDLFAVSAFRRHVRWQLFARLLPPAFCGVLIGYFWLRHLSNAGFKPVIGWLVMILLALQLLRQFRPAWFQGLPQSRAFAWSMGVAAGITTMLANAAGPIMTLFLLALELPKLEFVGTAAWFFLVVNLTKVPFSASLGFIGMHSLAFNLVLAPLVGAGVFVGRLLLHRMDQKLFEWILVALTTATAIHLIFG